MEQGFWIFGYGSLLWDPGFEPVETQHATLVGYRRSFCMWSHHHRGTLSRPGLVLALDKSKPDSCRGLALKVSEKDSEIVLAELRRRELISYAYYETEVELEITELGKISALTYVVNRDHHQYCQISLEEQAHIIAKASGGRGHNKDYLTKTVYKLHDLGIGDSDLDWLHRRVQNIISVHNANDA